MKKFKKWYMDLQCPYCDAELEINHDDGFGYEQDVVNEMGCKECGKNFVFTTSISFHYEPKKADCLNNGGKHKFELTHTHPKEFSKMRCIMCDKERELTNEERKLHNIGTPEEYFKSLI